MGKIDLLDLPTGIPRRTLMVFLLVDKSGSMYGARINALNKHIHDFTSYLRTLENENPNMQFSLSILEFSTEAKWMYETPLWIGDFVWKDISPEGLTNFGEACKELNSKLTRNGGYMYSPSGMCAPVIVLMTDGGPTDDFKIYLEQLENNNWYKHAHKISIGIGIDVDCQFINEFTTNEKNSIIVKSSNEMRKVFHNLALYINSLYYRNDATFSEYINFEDETEEVNSYELFRNPMVLSGYAPIWAISRHRIHTDGYGITTLVALSGCQLSCKYCINPTCKSKNAYTWYSPSDLYNEVKIDRLYFKATNGGITFGGGEPCMHYRFIKSFREINDWNITIETSLNVVNSIIQKLADAIDYWIIDVKDMNPKIYKEYTGKSNSKVLENLKWLAAHNLQDKCIIRIPHIPNYNNSIDQKNSEDIVKSLGFQNIELFDYVNPKNGRTSFSISTSDQVEWDERELEGFC